MEERKTAFENNKDEIYKRLQQAIKKSCKKPKQDYNTNPVIENTGSREFWKGIKELKKKLHAKCICKEGQRRKKS